MKPPQYKTSYPEYLGDKDMKVVLSSTNPKFASAESYIKNNVATKVLENKQIGEATFIVAEPGKGDEANFSMVAIVPNQPIGWNCTGTSRARPRFARCARV
jgi:hypothetical protein